MKLFYQISTHWDREWWLPFQGFRFKLVKMTEDMLTALESGALDTFTFDGQTVVLEDYLEIRPGERERLRALIEAGKLRVGPWYVMPDELLVSGESLVRNFLMGHAVAKSFGGEAWKYGYVNDVFGHIAQFPQILAGFGIKSAYLGRGVGRRDQNYTNFRWEAPDGTAVFAYKQCYATARRTMAKAESFDDALASFLAEGDATGCVIVNYTDDHACVDENTFRFQEAMHAFADKLEVTEGLHHIAEAVAPYADSLPVERGELIAAGEAPGAFRVVTSSISSWYPVKRDNDACEKRLFADVCPTLAAAKLRGIDTERGFFDLACRYLLKNQPHDSICGCSIDRVHEDMRYRTSQVLSLSDAITGDIRQAFGLRTVVGEDGKAAIFNPSPKPIDGVFTAEILLSQAWSGKFRDKAGYQVVPGFALTDASGAELPMQILSLTKNFRDERLPHGAACDRFVIAASGHLEPLGVTTFTLIPKKNARPALTTSPGVPEAENEFLRLIVENGHFTLLDKESGRTYRDLMRFTDDSDCGNGWFHETAYADGSVIVSDGAPTETAVICRGELQTKLRVTTHMHVPASADYAAGCRSADMVPLDIVTEAVITKGSREVEFTVIVNNTARDHRLRAEFPTGIAGDDWFASQAFTTVTRRRGVEPGSGSWVEPEPDEKNMSGIFGVRDEISSLAFVGGGGLHEGAVYPDGTLSATLLCCFGRSLHSGVPSDGAQLIGKHTFRFALTTEKSPAKLHEAMARVGELLPIQGTDAAGFSLLKLEGDVTASIVKPTENGRGIVLRVYNPADAAARYRVAPAFTFTKAYTANLLEEPCGLFDPAVEHTLRGHGIETIVFEVE